MKPCASIVVCSELACGEGVRVLMYRQRNVMHRFGWEILPVLTEI